MGDIPLILSVPALVLASGLWTVCDCWWRRRHPAPPSPYTRHSARLTARETLARAEAVIDSTYATLGCLYERPATPRPAARAARLTAGAGTRADRGPSQPVPARKR